MTTPAREPAVPHPHELETIPPDPLGPGIWEELDLSSEELELRDQLRGTWTDPGGLWGWLSTTSHTSIAKRYIATAFIFFLLGGLEAGMMRLQLARPENTFLGP